MKEEAAGALLILAQSGLLLALSVPLAQGKVRPNALYGVRTPKTLSDPGTWYRANRIGGRALFVAGALTGAASLLALALGDRIPKEATGAIPVGTLLVTVLGATFYTLRAVSKM